MFSLLAGTISIASEVAPSEGEGGSGSPSGGSTEESTPETIEKFETQYFELRATEIKNIDGKNRQVIMELYGKDIEFKRILSTFYI